MLSESEGDLRDVVCVELIVNATEFTIELRGADLLEVLDSS